MKLLSIREIADAAQQGEGFCLSCGHRQDFLEMRLVLGLCQHCGEYEVASADLMERVERLLEVD